MTHHSEKAFAIVMKNRMIALHDRHVQAIFTEKSAALAFKRVMASRLIE